MKMLNRMIFCVGICILLVLAVSPVLANGSPVKVFLSYLPEFSTYGPEDASGVALISIGEAWVELTADGLPQLVDESYEAWVIDAQTEDMISLGKFNADADGHVAYYAELDELPQAEYRYLVISVEPDPDPSPEADARWTIGGVFPNPELKIVSGTPTPTPEPGVTPSPEAPPTLPTTGGTQPYLWVFIAVLLALGVIPISSSLLSRKKRRG